MSTDPNAPKTDVPERKTLWNTILTATPILLTVVGTLLASRSSSEMTQAMYYRSVAAQNQSKASDQWAFFQAKRVRGTIQQMFAERGAFLPATELAVANRLPKALERSGSEAKTLLDTVDAALKSSGANSGSDLETLKRAVVKYQAEVHSAVKEAKKSQTAITQLLGAKDSSPETVEEAAAVQAGLTYLTSTKLPVPADEPKDGPRKVVDAVLDKQILEVLEASRQLEKLKEVHDEKQDAKIEDQRKEVEKLIRKLSDAKIRNAIETAEAKAVKFDKGTDPATKAIRKVEGMLQTQQAVLRPVLAAANEVEMAVQDLPADGKLSDVRKSADILQTSVGRLETEISSVSNRFKEAHCDFDVRRYGREGNFNLEVAALYELQVYKSALSSDQHRDRSTFYMYAMLAAQAGVTIATFGLAVRQKSIFWALATAAGVTAITIAIFAYQFI